MATAPRQLPLLPPPLLPPFPARSSAAAAGSLFRDESGTACFFFSRSFLPRASLLRSAEMFRSLSCVSRMRSAVCCKVLRALRRIRCLCVMVRRFNIGAGPSNTKTGFLITTPRAANSHVPAQSPSQSIAK